jgi:hypothetical protein
MYLFHKRDFLHPCYPNLLAHDLGTAVIACSLFGGRVALHSPKIIAAIKDGTPSPFQSAKSQKEMLMKLVILGLLVAALIAASPIAFAQQSSGKASGQEMQDKSSMKASHARKHEGKTVGAKPSSPDRDNTSVPGASVDKDDTTPKSR